KRVLEPWRHRLFAPDMLAGLQRLDRHLGMEGVRRSHRDDVDLRIVEEIAPVGGARLETEGVRLLGGEARIDVRELRQSDCGAVAEDGPHCIPCQRVALAHEPGTDEADADRLHSRISSGFAGRVLRPGEVWNICFIYHEAGRG